MRWFHWVAALSVVCASPVIASQVRPTVPPAGQRLAEQQNEQEMEQLLKHFASLVGQLTPEADKAFQRWEGTVNAWLREPGSGAGARLAAGVMYDCLTRLRNVMPPVLSDHKDILVWSIPEKRLKQAADSLKAAMNLDASLVEARFRFDRIRGARDRSATADLERLATESIQEPFGYLAALSRAEFASSLGDRTTAERWYERSLALFPGSTAARIALSTFRPAAGKPLDAIPPGEDPYYSYPCRIMTPEVSSALAQRLRSGAGK